MSRKIVTFISAVALMTAASMSLAADITGSYGTGDGTDGNQATPLGSTGPWTLTATNSTFSYVFRNVDQNITFADLTNFNAVFSSTTGTGGGSPRLLIGLQDGANEEFLNIYLGDSPNFTDSAAVLNGYSGVNLIGNNDAGRYDDSAFAGGSPFTTYSSALALIGGLKVDELDMVVDTFDPFGDRTITLDSLNAQFNAVPVPASAWPGLALLGGLATFSGIKRLRRQMA